MFLHSLHRIFNTRKYQLIQQRKHVLDLHGLFEDLSSPSKGIVGVSRSLYNFLLNDYKPFSLKQFKDGQTIRITSYAPTSTELADYLDKVYTYESIRYQDEIKSIPDHYTKEQRFFNDWFDNNESVTEIIESIQQIINYYLLCYDIDYDEGQLHDLYKRRLAEHKAITDKYPDLLTFINHKDYRILIGEFINLLIALHEVNVRSLSESTRS